METKVCNTGRIHCNQEKLIEEFILNKKTNSYGNQCRECRNKTNSEYQFKPDINKRHNDFGKKYRKRLDIKQSDKEYRNNPTNKLRKRIFDLKQNYNMVLEDYNNMLQNQYGVCAICKIDKPNNKDNYFHIDHNHNTNQIRGLLCYNCNNGLGYFNDDINMLQSIINYLKQESINFDNLKQFNIELNTKQLRRKNYELKHNYNISLNQYFSILNYQNNKCAICITNNSDKINKYFCVDHNHDTNQIRGLLCVKCNQGIGKFKDNINILQTAINYLSKD